MFWFQSGFHTPGKITFSAILISYLSTGCAQKVGDQLKVSVDPESIFWSHPPYSDPQYLQVFSSLHFYKGLCKKTGIEVVVSIAFSPFFWPTISIDGLPVCRSVLVLMGQISPQTAASGVC